MHACTHAHPSRASRHILFCEECVASNVQCARPFFTFCCHQSMFIFTLGVHYFVMHSVCSNRIPPFSEYNNLMHCKNIARKLHHELNFSASTNAPPPPVSLTSVSHIVNVYSSFVENKHCNEHSARKKKMLIT